MTVALNWTAGKIWTVTKESSSDLLSASGGLLLITVATESTDGFQRYLRSTQVNKLEGKVSDRQSKSSGQFIGRPQTFVELQLRFKLHFPSVKMQFET